MPSRTRACRTGSKCLGGRWRLFASALLESAPMRALSATLVTAAIARRLLRDRSGMTGAAIPMRWPLYKPQLRISRPERRLGLVEAIGYPADWATRTAAPEDKGH